MAACLALAFAACGPTQSNNQTASGPPAAVQSKGYPSTGVVKAIDPKLPAIEIDHQEIVGLMPAMQMEFPVQDRELLNGIAINDRIDFTVENNAGELRVIAIKKK